MAKAKPITGLDPHAPTGENARAIARVRLEEMYSWSEYVDDPYDVKDLHNLRIAAKRLRYTLEVFEDFLPEDCKPIVEELTKIQDELGALHDSDVMIGLLRLCLGSQESVPMYEQALMEAEKQQGKSGSILRPELVATLIDAKVMPSAHERYGLEKLLQRHEREREEQYTAFRQHWDQLQERDFRRQILDILNR